MNCADVQHVLPEVMDGGQNTEFQAHVKSCPVCSELVSDLELIANEARQLAATDEPAPRVWVKIAGELRAEGIIREPEATPARPVLVPSGRRWNAWWLVPVAAALVVAGSYVIKPKPASPMATTPAVVAPQAAQQAAQENPAALIAPAPPQLAAGKKPPVIIPLPKDSSDRDDQEFLEEVSRNAPMMRATYENQLYSVNSYIHDARAYAEQNPGDEDARQHLMDAYEQKSMLYQMALDNVQ
jgi:hypothetical protein